MFFLSAKKLGQLIDVQVQKRVIGLLPGAVNNVIEAKDKTFVPPKGYNPIEAITGCLYEWLAVPFSGSRRLIQVRYFESDISFIERNKYTQVIIDTSNKSMLDMSTQEVIDYGNAIEQSCRLVMNNPTFEELVKVIFEKDRYLQETREWLEETKAYLETMPEDNNEAQLLKTRCLSAELKLAFPLPLDTMQALSLIACGSDKTDIRKITRDIYLTAYYKHKNFGGSPAQYIPEGVYTNAQKIDIENACLAIGLEDEKKNHPAKHGRVK